VIASMMSAIPLGAKLNLLRFVITSLFFRLARKSCSVGLLRIEPFKYFDARGGPKTAKSTVQLTVGVKLYKSKLQKEYAYGVSLNHKPVNRLGNLAGSPEG
jgi:hypothetical protein